MLAAMAKAIIATTAATGIDAMANFLPQPLDQFTPVDSTTFRDYLARQSDFLKDVAKLGDTQTFTGVVSFQQGDIGNTAILLASDYNALINIKKLSSNILTARSGGGNAGIYLQHLIDNTTATINNVNSGIRVQVETYQQSTAAVNDAVAVYGGLYNGGVNVGAFGFHIDAYHAGTGTSTSFYGFNAEMFRTSAAGFTVAFHARCIDSPGYLNNDFAFLASPSPGGNLKFNSIFAAGSVFTGTMQANVGLDLSQANCTTAAIEIGYNQYMVWDANIGSNIKQRYESAGAWRHYVAGANVFGIENSGRLFIAANGSTVYTMSAGASGQFLAMNIGGTVYKIALDNF